MTQVGRQILLSWLDCCLEQGEWGGGGVHGLVHGVVQGLAQVLAQVLVQVGWEEGLLVGKV